MPRTSFDAASFANRLLAKQGEDNRKQAASIVKATFLNPKECNYNLHCMGVEEEADGTLVAGHRFRPYNQEPKHTGLSDAILVVELDKGIALKKDGSPDYKIMGDPSGPQTREGYTVREVIFGKFDGKNFVEAD